jgi:hypothetical protein
VQIERGALVAVFEFVQVFDRKTDFRRRRVRRLPVGPNQRIKELAQHGMES